MPAPEKLRYTHKAMADQILANPGISQGALAAMFGFTPGWVSQVINSDGFQAYLASRREEVLDPLLLATAEERFRGLLVKSINVLQESLATQPSPDVAAKTLEISARALGYGAKQAGGDVNVQFVVALPEKAPSGEAWLASRPVIDVTPARG